MSVTFKKRLFGADPNIEVIKEFERLGTGGELKYIGEDPETNEPLTEVNPNYSNYDLGDKTPFSRMWCAVSVNEWRQEAWEKYKGEKIYRSSKGEWYYFIDEDESQQKVMGDDAEADRLIFSVNEHNKEDSYSTPLEPLQISGESGKIKFQKQLSVNPLMKPEAGITSVRVKTQGAIGALLNATVEFVVHNKHDFENIFLPFFMKPGAIVCLDYGWSDVPLYNIVSQIREKDIDMSEFDSFIYHPNLGYLANNYGKVRTVIGNVVSYDASMTPEGGFNCSIEIVSRNAGLLDKKIDGGLQNLFVNSMNDILALLFAKNRNIGNSVSLTHIYKSLTSADTSENTDLIAKRFISELSDERNSSVNAEGVRVFNKGVLPQMAVERGIYHQDMSPNKTLGETNRVNEFNSKKTEDAKKFTQQIVSDSVLQTETTYMSYGLFEDLFLNNLCRGTIVRKKEIDTSEERKLPEKESIFIPGENYENNYDTRDVYVRWSTHFQSYQEADLEKDEALPIFLIPDNWDVSYNSKQLEKFDSTDSYVDFKTNTELSKTGKHPQYEGIGVVPLREIFISVSMVSAAFKSKDTVNDALMYLYDQLNEASAGIWNLRITSNDSSTSVTAQDVNLLPIQQNRLIFDVTGPKSIVSGVDLKYTTPKEGLSSILAIGSMSGPQGFQDIDLSQFSFLNLLNKPVLPDKLPHIRPLPNQGDINRLTVEEAGLTLSLTGLTDFVNSYEAVFDNPESTEPTAANLEKLDFYYKQLGLTKEVEETTEKKPKKEEKTSVADPSKAYQYQIKKLDVYNSERELFKIKMKDDQFESDGEGTISPILPIELSLSIYGNTYLQIGDRFTINYLPEYYRDRVDFQIVGYEDEVTPNGWTTNYTTLMRVNPVKKSIITGNTNKRDKSYGLNAKKNPMDKLTSVTRYLDDVPPEVAKSIEAITQKHEIITLNSNAWAREEINKTNGGLKLSTVRVTVAESDSWKNIVTQVIERQSKAVADITDTDENIVIKKKITKKQVNLVSSFGSDVVSMSLLRDVKNLAFSYAVRQALFSNHSRLDWKKIKPKFLTRSAVDITISKKNLEKEIREMGDHYMLIMLDNRRADVDIRKGIFGPLDGYDITDAVPTGKRFAGIDRVKFELHEDLKGFLPEVVKDEMGEDLRYETGIGNDKRVIHTFIRMFVTRLNEKIVEEQTMTVFVNKTKISTFPTITIPDWMWKPYKDKDNPNQQRAQTYLKILQFYRIYIENLIVADPRLQDQQRKDELVLNEEADLTD